MKGAQIGLTAAAENVIAYWIDESPAEIMFISATEPLLKKWATKRLEPLIDSCGIREKIYAQTGGQDRRSRRSGDTIFVKEYAGGCLEMVSAQSPSSLRSSDKRVLIRDEIDGAPVLLRTGEGNWLAVSYARTNSWGHRRKVLDFSTPTTYDESLIWREFEEGDQRKFFVPCPFCGKYQALEWNLDSEWGFKGDTKAGWLNDVYYLCEFCREPIRNNNKGSMLKNGRWEPTSKSFSKTFRSYHISSLYSPIGMLTWHEIYQIYMKAEENPDEMRSFRNLYLGLPYREIGARPKPEKVYEARGTYLAKQVQDGVLFLTAGADVQRGSETDESNPPRIEMEICGHGAGYKTWSVDYQIFYGSTDAVDGGAWESLREWAIKTSFQYSRDDGMIFSPVVIFIDSGDGEYTDVVYRFCSGWRNTFPTKGYGMLKKTGRGEDEKSVFNFDRYRPRRVGDTVLYSISTNYYKNIVYRNLKVERVDDGPQKPGFCDFPRDYPEAYFKMLTAEEKRRDGSYYAGGRRNEALDCRVLNLAAHDVYLESAVLDLRAAYKARGAHPSQLQQITRREVLRQLTEKTKRLK